MLTKKSENINAWITHLGEESKFNISVDCVIFGYDEKELKVLLMESDMPMYKGMLSLVGDLLKQDETIGEAAQRVLYKTTNLDNLYLEQVQSFSGLKRHPLGRVITLAYYSLIKISHYKIADNMNRELQWVSISNILEMAFDHKEIVDISHNTLKKRLRDSPVGFELLPKKFSLLQLQNLYETVLSIKMDKRNFRRKLNNLDLLIDLDEIQDDVSHRPAKLYSFDHEKYENLQSTEQLSFVI